MLTDSENGHPVRSKVATALQRWVLPAEFIDELIANQNPVTYEKSSILFVSGSPSDMLFLVVDGVVRLYTSRPDGTQSTFLLTGPGELLGFASLNEGTQRVHCFDASAFTKCSVFLFTRRHLLRLLSNQSPPILQK